MILGTHVLDTVQGRPAQGMTVRLDHELASRGWRTVTATVTDADGRIHDFGGPLERPGVYRLVFDTGDYYRARGVESWYPEVAVQMWLSGRGSTVHVPLLLSPYAYSTYRGS